jgi:hypothetical protein
MYRTYDTHCNQATGYQVALQQEVKSGYTYKYYTKGYLLGLCGWHFIISTDVVGLIIVSCLVRLFAASSILRSRPVFPPSHSELDANVYDNKTRDTCSSQRSILSVSDLTFSESLAYKLFGTLEFIVDSKLYRGSQNVYNMSNQPPATRDCDELLPTKDLPTPRLEQAE